MHATLSAALRHVLMEQGRACIPGIGTLIVSPQPALVSLIERKAVPPSAMLGFNGNLVVDDGRLRQYLSDTGEGDYLLTQLKDQLADGQTAQLEGIGKLYPDPGGEYRFVASGDNFSKQSFGLPSVTVQPIIRKEKVRTAPPTTVKRSGRERPVRSTGSTPQFTPEQRRTAFIVLGTILGLSLLAFVLIRSLSGPHDRAAAIVSVDRLRPTPPPTLARPPVETPTEATVPPPTAAPVNTAIIAIGLYGRQRNVAKQEGRLREAGYEPVTDPEGRNTRVGVKFMYDAPEDLRAALADIRSNFAEEAYVMRLNGELRRPE